MEGLLAAARPGRRGAAVPPRVDAPPASAEAVVAAVAPGEDLSPEERIKRHLHPLDSFVRLLECVSANRPPDPDDRLRFQWFGLFYQAPEQDGFTLRLRLAGGRLKPFQLAGLADITQRFAGGHVLLNRQGGLDLPGVPVMSVAELLEQVEGIGLSAQRTGGDCVQAVRGGELDDLPGGGGEGSAPVYPLVRALEQALARGPTFSDLPRPCEMVVQQVDEPCIVRPSPSIDTIILRLLAKAGSASKEESAPTRDASVLLQLPGEAKEGFLLPYLPAVSACLELLRGWAAGADRSSREKASLAAFLTGLGPDATCALLGGARRVPLPPGSTPSFPPVESPASPGFAVPDGRLLSGQLTALQRCCQEQGGREIRLRHGHVYVAGPNGKILDAAAAMRRALST